MASKEIFATPAGIRLLAGLDWRILDATQSVESALRSVGKERAATHAVTAKAHTAEQIVTGKKKKEIRRVAGGFLVSAEENEGPGKKAHSVAAAFAAWTRDHPKSALSVRTSNGKVAVVVVLDGLPTLDKVYDDDAEAYAVLAGYIKQHDSISVFADDLEKFPTSILEVGLLESIATSVNKSTLIKPIPVDVVKLALIGVLAAAAFGGYHYWDAAKVKEEKRLARLAAQEADPLQLYIQAFEQSKSTVGAERSSIISALREVEKIPYSINGWRLRSVFCEFGSDCVVIYLRQLGTYEGLKSAVPNLTLDMNGSFNLNEGRLLLKQDMKPQIIDVSTTPVDNAEFIQGKAGSLFQNWIDVGLGLQIQPPVLWPSVPTVPPSFKDPQAIALGLIDVNGIALMLVDEVVLNAPSNVIWKSFSISVDDAKTDGPPTAMVKLSGSYYVRN